MVDITALNTFKNLNLGNENSIATMDNENNVTSNSTFSKANIFRFFRSSSTQTNNNQIRTEFLKSLGKAFGLEEGIGAGPKGEVTFSGEFMEKLEKILGPAFKKADYGIPAEGGAVKSGKPLTQRRISQIMTQISAFEQKDFSVAAYKDKLSFIMKDLGMPDVTGMSKKDLDKMFENNKTARIFADIQKSLDFLENHLDRLIKNDTEYDFQLELTEDNPQAREKLIEKTENKFNILDLNLEKLDLNTDKYVTLNEEKLQNLGQEILWPLLGGELIHTERANFNCSTSETIKPLKDYIANTIKSFVKNGIDSYLEAKQQAKLNIFHDHVKTHLGACMEDKAKNFYEFRQENFEGPVNKAEETEFNSIINRNKAKNLKEMIESELDALFKQNPDGEWKDYAPVIKEKLEGKFATVIVLNENHEYTELKENGKVVVRALTAEDIDRIGESIYDDILMGA